MIDESEIKKIVKAGAGIALFVLAKKFRRTKALHAYNRFDDETLISFSS